MQHIERVTAMSVNGDLAVLQNNDTCTIANALDILEGRPRTSGYCSSDIRALFPELGIMAGYAVTARVCAREPITNASYVLPNWYETILAVPEPRVIVLEDTDVMSAGAFWGEIQGNVHRALGCVGTIGSAAARDLSELRALSFHVFAPRVILARGYMHMTDCGTSVSVGGTTISTGDIVQADQHGAQVVPHSALASLEEQCRKLVHRERETIDLCRSADFSVAALRRLGR